MISREVLEKCAPTALGKFLVAEVDDDNGKPDATTHDRDEKIVGYVPKEQTMRYVDIGDGYVKATCDVLISKIYAPDFCEIFSDNDTCRPVSVEMMVDEVDSDNGIIADAFCIFGITVLGKDVLPSCPVADVQITRFSQVEEQKAFFQSEYSLWKKREKVEEKCMANENLSEFAPEIVEQVRAEQGNDAEVTQVENDHIIFEKDGKVFQVECTLKENADGELQCSINWESLEDVTPSEEEQPAEEETSVEENQAEEESAEEETPVEENQAEEETPAAEPQEGEPQAEEEEAASEPQEEEASDEEDMGCGNEDKLAELEAIIMAKDEQIAAMEAELAELRAFKEKADCEARDFAVQSALESVRDCFNADEFEALKEEGFALELSQVDGFINKIKSQAFDVQKSRQSNENFSGIWRMSVPNNKENKSSLWK